MPGEVNISVGALFGFMLVLARISGAMVFVPLPGFGNQSGPARIALALGFTMAMFPRWPVVSSTDVAPATLAGWAVSEAAVGIAIGVSVAIVLEGFTFAAQVFGLPAGYGYASTVDPTTQADSGILMVLSQLVAGMLFFALGLDREVFRLFALSLDRIPVGTYPLNLASADTLIRLGSKMFSVGVRLALPIVALLAMVDVALALVGRLNAQLQLLSLAFPAKMLTALVMLTWLAVLYPRIMASSAADAWTAARRMLGI